MNLRQFYARALLASLPIAAKYLYDASEEADETETADQMIANLAHDLAYHAAANFSGQMDIWDEADQNPDRPVKTSQDRTDSSATGASSLN